VNWRIGTIIGMLLLMAALGAAAASPFTALHPEEAYPDPNVQTSPDLYSGFIRQVQEKLLELGFAAGPANGDFGAKTQAALAQFQLSRAIPASGQLDDQTLAELGVTRNLTQATVDAASTGASGVQPDDREQPESETGEKPGG
jgi:peptidoglycan hydrolase-like protein with peptidoglycan-binding domain